jgi:hypothetical protein
MKRGRASSLSIVLKIDRVASNNTSGCPQFSTDPEEIFVEIMVGSFTKLLQAHTYNTLHTLAARSQSFFNERINPFGKGHNSQTLQLNSPQRLQRWSIPFFPALLIVGPLQINANRLRQTFGERFLKLHSTLEFSNEFECPSIAFATIQTHKRVARCE